MKEKLLAFIDTETSGRNFDLHELLSLGTVLVQEKMEGKNISYIELGSFEWKVQPEHIHTAEPESLRINHYDPSLWQDAKLLREVLVEFLEKVHGATLVGQNIPFDLGFIEHALHQENLEPTYHYHSLDTVSLATALLRNETSLTTFSLRELTQHFGITHTDSHTALSDARATFEVYKKLFS